MTKYIPNQSAFTPKQFAACNAKPVTKRSRRACRDFGKQWETNVAAGIRDYLRRVKNGFVLPVTKPKYGHQIIDILVDNADGDYFGIECKSSSRIVWPASRWFRGGKTDQYVSESEFLDQSNRIGILAVVLPCSTQNGIDPMFGSYFVPWAAYARGICTGRVTTGLLDELAEKGYVYKIPTDDGRVDFGSDRNVFGRVAAMHRRICNITDAKLEEY